MLALPHFSPRIIVGVASTGLAAIAWFIARSMRGFPSQPHLWLLRFFTRSISDIRRRDRTAVAWIGLVFWSGIVTIFHFTGLVFEIYITVSWWDLLTHTMSGSGIAALALLTHRERVVTRKAVWWIVPTVIAIGAGFEVYEFVFRSFWHEWTLRHYSIDTAVDLAMSTLGTVVVASVANHYWIATDDVTAGWSTPNNAD